MTEQLIEERADLETGTAVEGPIRVSWAPVPKVNLLPIEIIEGRRFRRTQLLLGAAVLGSVLIAGGGTFWAQQGINDANDQLLRSQSGVSALQTEEARYAAVPQVIAQVDAATADRTLAMSRDVLWYRYLDDLDGARPTGLQLSAITVTMNAAGASLASADPLTPTGIGLITVTGTTDQYSKISSWLEALNKITGFSKSSLTSAITTSGSIMFNSGAVVDSDALSSRYEKKAG
jgi:Tfp pilus assembly protein PilN